MDCTNKNCPAYAKCLAPYRGSRCKATRATYGLGDPMTNADKLRAMSDEELAEWIETIADCRMCKIDEGHCSGGELNTRASCMIHWLYWLKQEAPHDQP